MRYIAAVLFRLLKAYAKLALKIFCRKIIVNKPEWLTAQGPLLLASNHPNSFLDGIIITVLFEQYVYSLARGDAFRNHKHAKLLRWLHLLPVYRTSEGVENLEHNYKTFESCIDIFKQNGIVMIFSEGRCVNEWHLRPLKKGTARLATSTWLEDVDLTVLPVGLNYNSFRNFGKNVFINFGEPIKKEEVLAHNKDGKMFLTFNEALQNELGKVVFQIDPADKTELKRRVSVKIPLWEKFLLAVPAFFGFLVHIPLYFPVKALNGKYFDNDHFDSTLVGILVFTYPIYLLLLSLVVGICFSWLTALSLWFILPFCAWACVRLKPQIS